MAKFKSTADGPITVSTPVSTFTLEPGETVETDDPQEVAALEANTDVAPPKPGRPPKRSDDR